VLFYWRTDATSARAANSNEDRLDLAILTDFGKNRRFGLFGIIWFLGLAFCVFAWGFGYKLSLYDQSRQPSHQIPIAKLLSGNEQSSNAKSPLVIRTKTFTRVVYAASTAPFLFLLFAVSLLSTPPLTRVDRLANNLLILHRAILHTLFVRPPPILV